MKPLLALKTDAIKIDKRNCELHHRIIPIVTTRLDFHCSLCWILHFQTGTAELPLCPQMNCTMASLLQIQITTIYINIIYKFSAYILYTLPNVFSNMHFRRFSHNNILFPIILKYIMKGDIYMYFRNFKISILFNVLL